MAASLLKRRRRIGTSGRESFLVIVDDKTVAAYPQIFWLVRQKLRHVIGRERAAAQDIHCIMCTEYDPVVAVFGGARKHFEVSLRYEERQDQ